MSNFVRMFQPRFIPLILTGEKTSTIRQTPIRMPQMGDTLMCRKWSGLPYRSLQVTIKEVRITLVSAISLGPTWAKLEGESLLEPYDLNQLATDDGFEDWFDLVRWFEAVHSLPFRGIRISWLKLGQTP